MICKNRKNDRKIPPLTFLIRKVSQRISHRIHHFILAKLLKLQETFLEKFLVSGFGEDAPTDNTHKKHGVAVFFILSKYVGTAFQTSFSYFSYKKSKQKNFPPNTPLHFKRSF